MPPQTPGMLLINGKEVARLRTLKGWDREALVKRSGCKRDNLNRIEASEAVNVRPTTATWLAGALGVEIEDLLADAGVALAATCQDEAGVLAELGVCIDVRVWGAEGGRRHGLSISQAPKALRDWTTVRWQPDIDNSPLFRPATLGARRVARADGG